jgi:hypothetical protein
MDNSQLYTFLQSFLDYRCVGIDSNGNGVPGKPICPDLKNFVIARLGDLTPLAAYRAVYAASIDEKRSARALADLLREVADGIDPSLRETSDA